MQSFVPSALSALQVLLKCPRWFLWKIVNLFISWRRSGPAPPQRPFSPYSPHLSRDSRSRSRSYRQVPTSRIGGVEATSQYHDYETPLKSYPPRRQPSALYLIETPLSYVVVTESVSPQPPRPATTIAQEAAVVPLVDSYPASS
ncbi:hypothetical protein K503DRAFT_536674 [Rhizopogon vinicolor AM-OR11-026]|uniref:Uncharacterized protein n=1 Tax=Rhizopogon vinicolor AM-OR11-026 TaxID=1314800 RepID=A0A1B7MKX9_9AGAM|nr:hypothetical protein K503DRAFT_536674 [Rhizopogon vinicolor AM-OR11-026]